MIKFEKVIKALECCKDINKLHCDDCAYTYNARSDRCECTAEMASDALELLKEIKPYGGFIEFPDVVGNLIGYTTIVEHMLKAGILKVEKQEAPMFTRYNWAIKAVKWE